jgi:hypothetical protein
MSELLGAGFEDSEVQREAHLDRVRSNQSNASRAVC